VESIIIIIVIPMIFIHFHRKERIISDTGYIKCEIFLFGLIIYFLSLNFNSFSNYINCALKFIFGHSGILLIYIIILIYIITGYELGLSYKEIEKLNIIPFQSSSQNDLDTENNKSLSSTLNEALLLNIEKQLNQLEVISNEIKLGNTTKEKSKTSLNSKYTSTFTINKLNKKVEFIHSLYLELITIYIIAIISFIIITIFYKFKYLEDIQEINGKWRYTCPLNSFNFILNLIEFILIIIILFKAIKLMNYTYIFKFAKYAVYIVLMWAILGPLVNVFYVLFLIIIYFYFLTNYILYIFYTVNFYFFIL